MLNQLYQIIILFFLLCACAPLKTPNEPGTATPSPVPMSTNSSDTEDQLGKLISPETADQLELVRMLRGHTNKVLALAFSGNGIYIASDSLDRTSRLWDVRSGQPVHTLSKGESEMIITNSIAFSPDGNLLASAEAIWDVKNGKTLYTLNRGRHAPVAFSPDGSSLAIALSDQPVKLWDIKSGQETRIFSGQTENSDGPMLNIVLSPDGVLLASSGHLNGLVQLWDVETEQIVHTLLHHTKSNIHALAFSPVGRLLASAGTDYTVILWDVASGKKITSLKHRDGLWSIAFSPNGSLLASAGCDGTVQIWEIASGKLLHTMEHSDQVTSVVFSPDGTLLAAGGYDNQTHIWGIPR